LTITTWNVVQSYLNKIIANCLPQMLQTLPELYTDVFLVLSPDFFYRLRPCYNIDHGINATDLARKK